MLSSLSAEDHALIAPHLSSVDLESNFVVQRPDAAIEHAYFIESGIVSVVAASSGGRKIEVGLIGREGMTGLAIVMDDSRSPEEVFVQVAGAGRRIAASDLKSVIAASRSLHRQLLRYAKAFAVQVTQTALANGRAKLEERLARWLLMARDRLDVRAMPLKHDFLALMLGVQRPGVTVALQEMEGRGLIRSRRGEVAIIDSDGLCLLAGEYYGVPEREYARLLGPTLNV